MGAVPKVPTDGGVVLIDEREPDLSYRLLGAEGMRRKRILCITREPPERAARHSGVPLAEYHWLIAGDGHRSIDPVRLDRVGDLVRRFHRVNPGGAVLIEGVEFLMVINSYERVRDLFLSLDDMLQGGRTECLVPIDTRTLTLRELRELRAAFPIVRGDGRV